MMPVFPTYVQINLQGYSEEYIPNIFRSEFEAGPAKQRPRYCKTQKRVKFTGYVCSRTEYKQFVQWWRQDVRQGALWFCFTDPCSSQEVKARIPNINIATTPIVNRANTNLEQWEIQFELEVWE